MLLNRQKFLFPKIQIFLRSISMKKIMSLSAAVAFALSGSAFASTVTLDTTSFGGPVVSNIAAFDWAPSNVLAKNGNQAFANFVNTGGACTASCAFDVYVQGKMTGFLAPGTIPMAGTGVGSSYEITFVIGFQEVVTGAVVTPTQNIAAFDFVPGVMSDGSPNFFRAYIDSAQNANDLAGTGFTDGTLLLNGGVAPDGAFTSSFTANTTAGSVVNIGGESGVTPAAWTGVKTVSGSGSTSTLDLLVAPAFVSSLFGSSLQSLGFTLTNASQAVPFNTVNPSLSFPIAGVANTLTEVGAVNGATTGAPGSLRPSGPSIIFQSDANSPLNGTYIPEPTALALLGIGFAGLALSTRRKANVAA